MPRRRTPSPSWHATSPTRAGRGHRHPIGPQVRSSTATDSTCVVCGNMSSGRDRHDSVLRCPVPSGDEFQQVTREPLGVARHVDHAGRAQLVAHRAQRPDVGSRARRVEEHGVERSSPGQPLDGVSTLLRMNRQRDGSMPLAFALITPSSTATGFSSTATTSWPRRASGIAKRPRPAYRSRTRVSPWPAASSTRREQALGRRDVRLKEGRGGHEEGRPADGLAQSLSPGDQARFPAEQLGTRKRVHVQVPAIRRALASQDVLRHCASPASGRVTTSVASTSRSTRGRHARRGAGRVPRRRAARDRARITASRTTSARAFPASAWTGHSTTSITRRLPRRMWPMTTRPSASSSKAKWTLFRKCHGASSSSRSSGVGTVGATNTRPAPNASSSRNCTRSCLRRSCSR